MNKGVRLILIGLATSVSNLTLHTASCVLFLRSFYAAHPSGSEAFLKELNKGMEHLVLWSLALSALSLGFFITLVVHWSGARTFGAGLRAGLAFGGLYWAGMDFGLYASSNNFSLASTLVDIVFSSLCMALSASFAAWMLGRAPHLVDARKS
ncbi:MAG: hypothetical protein U0235_10270 [Polyangiaceae bacterium]